MLDYFTLSCRCFLTLLILLVSTVSFGVPNYRGYLAVSAIVLLYPTHDTVLYTLSKATQIATFEAVPLSGINCPPPTNGIENHFRETQNPFGLGTMPLFTRSKFFV